MSAITITAVTPQGLLTLRLIFGDRAMLDLTGHEFYVSSMGATESGTENIVRLNAGLTVRLFDRHALGVRYIISNRDLNYSNPGRKTSDDGNLQPLLHFPFRHQVRRRRMA